MAEAPALVVHNAGGRFDVVPPSAEAIFGEYLEAGQNHGRRVYKRRPTENQRHLPQVVLFYWDARDGKDLAGWWFGDKIGGGQVWARNQASDGLPPRAGWRCPVDGPPQPKVICTVKDQAAPGAPGGQPEEAAPRAGGAAAAEAGGAAKRPARGAPPPRSAKRRPAPEAEAYVLSSRLGDSAPQKTQALLGEYTAQGSNHGRRTFFRPGGSGPVWLYYWDDRDGESASGWWLGEKVGGADVYGFSAQHSRTPPSGGWKVPHDERLQRDVRLLPKGREEEADMPAEERLELVRGMVADLEGAVSKALEAAQGVLAAENGALEEGVRAAVEQLTARKGDVEQAQQRLERHMQASSDQGDGPEVEAELVSQRERLSGLLDRARPELDRAQERLASLEQQASEERDAEAVAEALPGAMEMVSAAEMAAEAAASDEGAARARAKIEQACLRVNALLAAAESFAPLAREVAVRELKALRGRCSAAEERMALWEGGGTSATAPLGEDRADASADAGSLEDATEGVEAGARQALSAARDLAEGGGAGAEALRACVGLLQEQASRAAAVQARLSRALRGEGAGEAAAALGPRLEAARAQLERELAAVQQRARAKEGPQGAGAPAAAGAPLARARAASELAAEIVDALAVEAGDAEWRRSQVEAAAQAGESSAEIEAVVKTIQARADEAQAAIAAARSSIDEQIGLARKLPEEKQKAVLLEIAPMRKRVVEAQRKLNPYKRARAEYDQGVKARADLEALRGKVASVEADVEGVAAALTSQAAFEDEAAAVEASVQPTVARAAKLLQFLERRAEAAADTAHRQGLSALRQRAAAACGRLAELRSQAREQRQRALGQLLVRRAEAEAKKAEAWQEKIAEAQKPWAGGREVVPAEEATPCLESCTALARQAEPAALAAKTAALEALVEARQLADGASRLQVVAELQGIQARAEAMALKITQLKVDTFARTVRLQMADFLEGVVRAEREVAAVVEASGALCRDDLETVAPEALRAAGAAALAAEAPAKAACAAARQALEACQKNPRNRESPAFQSQLGHLRARLEGAERELRGLAAAAREAEASQRRLLDHRASLDRLEAAVAEAELQALPLGDESEAEQGGEAGRAGAVVAAARALASWWRTCDELAESPHGALQLAAGRLRQRGREVQARLDGAKELVRGELERAEAQLLREEGRERLEAAEGALARAEEAEGPFLIGLELDPGGAAEALAACEVAAVAARRALSAATSFVEARQKEVSAYARQHGAEEELAALRRRCEVVGERLAQLEGDTAARRRGAL